MSNFVKLCLAAFQSTLQQTLPSECVKKALQISKEGENLSKLTVANREYVLEHNVHIVAIGKAAHEMVVGAEASLGDHFVDGIASAPIDSTSQTNLKTRFYLGAANNLPDQNSLEASRKIAEFVKNVSRINNQIILFLISGGGSALLPAPIHGLTLSDKLNVIRLLTQNGADIKQLNKVRIALSFLKGGKLAALGAPAKMISLIMSDIVGDPIGFISSGPTVPQRSNPKEAIGIFEELNVVEKIPKKVIELLDKSQIFELPTVDVNNVIVANNSFFLNIFADLLRQNDPVIEVSVKTSSLEGDASDVGIKFAELIIEEAVKIAKSSTNETESKETESSNKRRIAFVYGGETTVRFPSHPIASTARGGRNQELILAALKQLSGKRSMLENVPSTVDFALFSLGTDGQDGPTNATGAYVTRDDVMHVWNTTEPSAFDKYLKEKNSYEFWTKWRDGSNHVKLGKTGTNLMDVQIVFIECH